MVMVAAAAAAATATDDDDDDGDDVVYHCVECTGTEASNSPFMRALCPLCISEP